MFLNNVQKHAGINTFQKIFIISEKNLQTSCNTNDNKSIGQNNKDFSNIFELHKSFNIW